MNDMVKFEYQGKKYGIDFISSYAGSHSYRLYTLGTTDSRRIETRFINDYARGSIERKALAAWKRESHNRFREWCKKEGMNAGQGLRFINQ